MKIMFILVHLSIQRRFATIPHHQNCFSTHRSRIRSSSYDVPDGNFLRNWAMRFIFLFNVIFIFLILVMQHCSPPTIEGVAPF